jgi:hypothetical protein
MDHNANENKYVQIITDALTSAQEMMKVNQSIFEKVLPSAVADEIEHRGRGVDFMFNELKHKVENGTSLTPPEVSMVNRALVEYSQRIDLAQTHFIHVNEDYSQISHFKEIGHDIYKVQIDFNAKVALDAGNRNDLDDVKSRLNNRPRP